MQIPALPDWMQNKSTTGKVARAATEFLVPFLGATKALKVANVLQKSGKATTLARGATAGAVADFSGQDPSNHLSTLLNDFLDNHAPSLRNPVMDYLAADPSDSRAEGRFKNVLEGLGIGSAVELGVGMHKGLKAVRENKIAKGENPTDILSRPPEEDLTAHAMDTSKPADLSLADQINLLTGVKKSGPSKFQKARDMKTAIADAEKAAPLEFSPSRAPARTSAEPSLVPKDALPFEGKGVASADAPTAPDTWKLVEEDPNPRKAFLDPQDGHIVMAQEAQAPHQLDLDLHIPEVIKKTERTPAEDAMLQGYKELQDKVLSQVAENAPTKAPAASKGATEGAALEDRIAKARARVDSLMETGGQMFKKELEKALSTERYQSLPENPDNGDYREAKETVIRRIYTQAQMAAQRKLLAADEGLRDKYLRTKRNAHNALSGLPLLPM